MFFLFSTNCGRRLRSDDMKRFIFSHFVLLWENCCLKKKQQHMIIFAFY